MTKQKKSFYTHLEACMRLSSFDKKRKTPLTWKILVTWVPSSARNGIFIARGSPSLLRFFPHPRLSATARPGPHGRTGIVRPFLHSAAFKKGFSFFNRDKIMSKKAKTRKIQGKNSTFNVDYFFKPPIFFRFIRSKIHWVRVDFTNFSWNVDFYVMCIKRLEVPRCPNQVPLGFPWWVLK